MRDRGITGADADREAWDVFSSSSSSGQEGLEGVEGVSKGEKRQKRKSAVGFGGLRGVGAASVSSSALSTRSALRRHHFLLLVPRFCPLLADAYAAGAIFDALAESCDKAWVSSQPAPESDGEEAGVGAVGAVGGGGWERVVGAEAFERFVRALCGNLVRSASSSWELLREELGLDTRELLVRTEEFVEAVVTLEARPPLCSVTEPGALGPVVAWQGALRAGKALENALDCATSERGAVLACALVPCYRSALREHRVFVGRREGGQWVPAGVACLPQTAASALVAFSKFDAAVSEGKREWRRRKAHVKGDGEGEEGDGEGEEGEEEGEGELAVWLERTMLCLALLLLQRAAMAAEPRRSVGERLRQAFHRWRKARQFENVAVRRTQRWRARQTGGMTAHRCDYGWGVVSDSEVNSGKEAAVRTREQRMRKRLRRREKAERRAKQILRRAKRTPTPLSPALHPSTAPHRQLPTDPIEQWRLADALGAVSGSEDDGGVRGDGEAALQAFARAVAGAVRAEARWAEVRTCAEAAVAAFRPVSLGRPFSERAALDSSAGRQLLRGGAASCRLRGTLFVSDRAVYVKIAGGVLVAPLRAVQSSEYCETRGSVLGVVSSVADNGLHLRTCDLRLAASAELAPGEADSAAEARWLFAAAAAIAEPAAAAAALALLPPALPVAAVARRTAPHDVLWPLLQLQAARAGACQAGLTLVFSRVKDMLLSRGEEREGGRRRVVREAIDEIVAAETLSAAADPGNRFLDPSTPAPPTSFAEKTRRACFHFLFPTPSPAPPTAPTAPSASTHSTQPPAVLRAALPRVGESVSSGPLRLLRVAATGGLGRLAAAATRRARDDEADARRVVLASALNVLRTRAILKTTGRFVPTLYHARHALALARADPVSFEAIVTATELRREAAQAFASAQSPPFSPHPPSLPPHAPPTARTQQEVGTHRWRQAMVQAAVVASGQGQVERGGGSGRAGAAAVTALLCEPLPTAHILHPAAFAANDAVAHARRHRSLYAFTLQRFRREWNALMALLFVPCSTLYNLFKFLLDWENPFLSSAALLLLLLLPALDLLHLWFPILLLLLAAIVALLGIAPHHERAALGTFLGGIHADDLHGEPDQEEGEGEGEEEEVGGGGGEGGKGGKGGGLASRFSFSTPKSTPQRTPQPTPHPSPLSTPRQRAGSGLRRRRVRSGSRVIDEFMLLQLQRASSHTTMHDDGTLREEEEDELEERGDRGRGGWVRGREGVKEEEEEEDEEEEEEEEVVEGEDWDSGKEVEEEVELTKVTKRTPVRVVRTTQPTSFLETFSRWRTSMGTGQYRMHKMNVILQKAVSILSWHDPWRSRVFLFSLLLATVFFAVVPARIWFASLVIMLFSKPLRPRGAGIVTILFSRFVDGIPPATPATAIFSTRKPGTGAAQSLPAIAAGGMHGYDVFALPTSTDPYK